MFKNTIKKIVLIFAVVSLTACNSQITSNNNLSANNEMSGEYHLSSIHYDSYDLAANSAQASSRIDIYLSNYASIYASIYIYLSDELNCHVIGHISRYEDYGNYILYRFYVDDESFTNGINIDEYLNLRYYPDRDYIVMDASQDTEFTFEKIDE